MEQTEDILFRIHRRVSRLKIIQLEYYSYFTECLESYDHTKRSVLSSKLGEDKYSKFVEVLVDDQLWCEQANKVFDSSQEAVDFFEFMFELEGLEDVFDTFNKSYVMHLHSILENSLNEICKIKDKNKMIKLNDIKGKGPIRSLIYLKKVCGFGVTENTESDIHNFLKVRNKFVHNNSLITENELKFFQTIKGIDIMKSSDDDNGFLIRVSNDFCRESTNLVFSLLDEILGARDSSKLNSKI